MSVPVQTLIHKTRIIFVEKIICRKDYIGIIKRICEEMNARMDEFTNGRSDQ